MPFRSKSQIRACYSQRSRNIKNKWNCDLWLSHTKNINKLPNKVLHSSKVRRSRSKVRNKVRRSRSKVRNKVRRSRSKVRRSRSKVRRSRSKVRNKVHRSRKKSYKSK